MAYANGIELSSSQYRELKALVEADDPEAHALSRLNPDGGKYSFDAAAVQTYWGLHDAGVIAGAKVMGGYVFKSMNMAGYDFVEDYERALAEEEASRKSDRRHDYKVEAFGAVCSIVLGMIIEHFTGIAGTILSTAAAILQSL